MAKATYKNPTAGLTLNQVEDLHREILSKLSHGYRLPYMQWFEDDFRGSEGVEEMTSLERLMYRQLLAKAWASKDAPYLPADEERLKRLSDCPSDELWEKHRNSVLQMFQESQYGSRVYHPRQLLDYVGQLAKVVANTENGGKGGRPKGVVEKITQREPNQNPDETVRLFLANPDETQTKPIKNQNQNLELKQEPESKLTESKIRPEVSMKAKTQIQVLCLRHLRIPAETFKTTWDAVGIYEGAFGSSELIRVFEQWAKHNAGDDFQGKPVTQFLKEAAALMEQAESETVDQKELNHLVGELAYISDGKVLFGEKQLLKLKEILQDNTVEEVVSVFRPFYQDLAGDDFKFAGGKFTQNAASLLYAARRKKAEKEAESLAVARQTTKMQEEAEAERIRHRAEIEKAESEVEDVLPD